MVFEEGLKNLEVYVESLSEDDRQQFFRKLIPFVRSLAAQLPDYFTDGVPTLLPNKAGEVKLTRKEIAVLLANMFFCTLPRPSWNSHWVDFSIWFALFVLLRH